MNDTENEILNYAGGNVTVAGLFARLIEMQIEVDDLICERDSLKQQLIDLRESEAW